MQAPIHPATVGVDAGEVAAETGIAQHAAHNSFHLTQHASVQFEESRPSDADRRITVLLKEALGLMDIRVIVHVVVGSDGCKSFTERGYL